MIINNALNFSLFCFSPSDQNISNKNCQSCSAVMAGIILPTVGGSFVHKNILVGVLFIKTCFCRNRKSASQQKSIVCTVGEVENNETEVKNKDKIENLRRNGTKYEFLVTLLVCPHPPFVSKYPSKGSH